MNRILLTFFFTSFTLLIAQPATPESGVVVLPQGGEVTRISAVSGTQGEKTILTKYYEVKVQSAGGEIASFYHLDPSSKTKQKIELTDSETMNFVTYPDVTDRTIFTDFRNQLLTRHYTLNTVETETTIKISAALPVTVFMRDQKTDLLFVKEYEFYKKEHYWLYRQTIENKGAAAVSFKSMYFMPFRDIGPTADDKSPISKHKNYSFLYYKDDFKTFRPAGGGMFGGKKESKLFDSSVHFFGHSGRFMIMTVQPLFANTGAYFFPEIKQDDVLVQHAQTDLNLGKLSIPPASKAVYEYIVYTGPKAKEYLKTETASFPYTNKIHKDLYKSFDFGITAPIRDLIVEILHVFYKLAPNYGVGIIVFALLFKLVFFHMNLKQAESMKKMAALQPLMKEINERYQNNPQEKQRRMMLLYKEHKINPLGGCLPMLIQIPIFIALYSAFSDSYDLWKSPFISGWTPDLSEPDTLFSFPTGWPLLGGFNFHILPILMAATQYLQTKFTVVSGDETQKRIMQLMPLLMLVFFWAMPAGVVLYWTIQNILSIGQQLYTNSRSKA